MHTCFAVAGHDMPALDVRALKMLEYIYTKWTQTQTETEP